MTLPSWASPATAWSRNASAPRSDRRPLGQRADRPGRTPPAPSGVLRVEQIHRGDVLALDQVDLQSRMKRVAAIQKSSRTMTIALDALAVALAQGLRPARCSPRPAWRAATARTGRARSAPSGRAGAMSPAARPRASRRGRGPAARSGSALRTAFSSRASVSSGVASM